MKGIAILEALVLKMEQRDDRPTEVADIRNIKVVSVTKFVVDGVSENY